MRTVIVTGSAGLIGSEAVKRFANEDRRVVGIDNDMRAQFFGAEASTKKTRDDLIANVPSYEHYDLDIRDASAVAELFKCHRGHIEAAIVHTASQPSHDWAARDRRSCVWHTWDKTEIVSTVARALLISSASRGGVDRNRN